MKIKCLALAFLLLLIPSFAAVAQQRVVFDAFEAFSINNPKGIGARDLNGDGILDIATCGDDYIAILLCNGDGTFQTAVKYYYQYDYDSFVSLVIDDFDNDGDADIAAACRFENAVVVFSNDGTGAFTAIGEYETLGYLPLGLCLSDFDGDGENDIAIRYQNGDSMDWEYISVLLSNGDGTFQPAVHSRPDDYWEISAFYPSDFDDDGDMDLAVAANLTDEVIILFGRGDGTFDVPTHNCTYSSHGEGPVSLSVSDFDLDDDADIVVVNEESCDFAILYNRGDGTFTGGSAYYSAICPDYIYCADIDADGDTDLYCTDMSGDMSVFLGDGTGNFQQDVYYYIGGGIWCPELCSGDFDLDGDTDLVASSSVSTIAALMNNGDGTLRSPTYYSYFYNPCTQIYSSDLDGDGNADLVSIYSSNTRMAVLLGIGDGTVEHLIDYVVGPVASSVVIEDYNGDGTEDLAVVNTTPHTVSIFLGNGDGTFQGKTDFPTGGASLQASAADFDGDGALDIALSNGYQRTVSILLGNGDGSFQVPESYPTTSYIKQPWGLCTSDFDGDGDNDIAVAGDSLYWDHKSLGVMMNNGDGTFQPPVRYESEWRTRKLAAADIDRDGDDDIIARYNYGIIVNRNNGDGTFQSWGIYSLSVGSFCVSDFNHDRNLDIVTVGESYSSPSLRLLMGNGDGTFEDSQIFVTGFSGQDVCAPDLDGDGDPDIAAALYFQLMTTLNLTPLATSAEHESITPSSPLLSQNFPNPFNPATTIRFKLPRAGYVRIAVYDAVGRRVAVVADRFFQAGDCEVVWDGRNERGKTLASGIYFARMTVGGFTATRKLVLLR